MATKIQLRRDLSSSWASTNPILAQGEPGVELDTNNMKIGDGVKNWNDLDYTVQAGGLTPVFVAIDDYYSNQASISENGSHWTATTNTGNQGTNHSNDWNVNDAIIGNGLLVYRGYNNLSDKNEIRYSTSPYQAAVVPDDDITRVGPNGEEIYWNSLEFGGGYFVVGGYYYDNVRNNYRYPIAAYSADGATWTKINIDLDYVKDIVDAQNNAYDNVGGMRISSVTYGTNGWLFALNYEQDNTYWQDNSNRLNPGAFYITSITTALNSSSYFATMPATDWSAWYDGHGWITYYNTYLIYKNSSSDPRQGSWTAIDWHTITSNIDFASSGDYYSIDDIAAGECDGINYMAMSDYYGVVYYSSDQGTTWNYVTPGPAYAGITYLDTVYNGGIKFSGGNGVNWGHYPESDWNGEKITISGSYVVELNGTWWIDDYDYGEGNWALYHDRAKTNRLDASGLGSLDVVEKYVNSGTKGDNSLILPDVVNIVVGQRIYGIDAVRTYEDRINDWPEPNIVTSVNSDTNKITLKHPLYQDFNNETLYFQALVQYTHGDEIYKLTYGGGKFIGFGNDTSRNYITNNMTEWNYTVGGNPCMGPVVYGALDVNKNALRNDSQIVPGFTNSLQLGDNFNVSIVALSDVMSGPYDYYGATEVNTGAINIDPVSGQWYLGVDDDQRGRVAIYSHLGYEGGFGSGNDSFDYYQHATGVTIETWNNSFYFDDYYGTFIAQNIAIGDANSYYDYYDYNHIDDIFFDGNDIYTSEGFDLNIYNYSSGINGGIYIHWDNTAKVDINWTGVAITDNGYTWSFTNDNDGVLYAPISSDIDIGGYWTIGQGNGSVGLPWIGATDEFAPDAYDFVIQAGNNESSLQNNYWYFSRYGNLHLPPSGNIEVSGYWQIGNSDVNIQAIDSVAMGEVYDLQIKSNGKYWYFLQNGNFQLASGGDIVNSDGASVLNQDIPQNAVSANGNYTLVIGDRGKHIYKTGTGNVLIPTNADVAFPIGTCVTLVTGSTNSTQITPVDNMTTTLILSKFGSDNTINVPADTYVTMLKIETDKWMIQT